MEQVKILRIVVASPGDVQAERDVLPKVIEELNRGIAGDRGLQLVLSRWETDAHPGFHAEGPQGLIDTILKITDCDLLIGIFWRRFGTPTLDGKTGTEHEIAMACEAWKEKRSPQVFIYFNQSPYTPQSKADTDQWGQVLEFKQNFDKQGLWWPYIGKAKFETVVRTHLTNYIRSLPKTKEQAEPYAADDTDLLGKYLDFIIQRNKYLDPRGIMQTRRSISLPLEEVFVTLKAEREARQDQIDRRMFSAGEEWTEALLDDPYTRAFFDRSPRTQNVELAKAVREQTRIVLLGDPGAGKTTLMRFLALQFSRAHRDGMLTVCDKEGNNYGKTQLPILMRVADYADAFAKDRNLHLRDYLPHSFTNLDAPSEALAKLFHKNLCSGSSLVLLDGLDEIVDRMDRSLIAREIEGFISAIDKRNRVIITSRIAGYRESPLDASLSLFVLRELEMNQIVTFLNRWCRAAEKFHAPEADESEIKRRAQIEIEGILNSVRGSDGVKRLASNPLMLTILALIHRNGARLPNRRVELYELAAKTLLEDWQLARGIPSGVIIQETEAMQILAPLAFWMHSEKPRGVASEGEVKDKLTVFLAKRRGVTEDHPDIPQAVDDFLRRVREHTGLFVERAPTYYGFMHLTFEEYFAARYLLRSRMEAAKLIHQFRHQPRWEEVTLLAVGYLSKDYPDEAAELIRTAIISGGENAKETEYKSSVYEDVLHRDLLFAAQCIGDCASVETEFRRLIMKRLIDCYISEQAGRKFVVLRKYIQDRIGYLKGSDAEADAVESLLEALKTNNAYEVRMVAVEALGWIGGERALEALLEALKKDDAEEVRRDVVSTLGRTGGERVLEGLLEALRTDDDADVRRNVVSALGQIGDERALEGLLEALKTDAAAAVRRYAADTLISIGGERAVEGLMEALKDGDAYVRMNAVSALGQIGGERAVVRVLEVLKIDDAYVRMNAASALGRIGGKRAVEGLLEALKTDDDVYVRRNAASALGRIGGERAVGGLLEALKTDDDADVRRDAADTLGRIGGERALDILLEALKKDDDAQVRRDAAYTLIRIGGERAVGGLLEALKTDDDVDVRRKAASDLGQIGGERAVGGLLEALKTDDDADVRRKAASALGQIGGERAVGGLLEALKTDGHTDVRRNATSALGQIGGERALEALFEALITDDDAQVRMKSVSALGQIGSERAVEGLLETLKTDDDVYVRRNAASALVKIGEERALEGLSKALKPDNTTQTRMNATSGLGLIGGERALDVLLEALNTDDDAQVRTNTAFALGRIGGERALEALLETLKIDDAEEVRRDVVSILGRIGGERALEALLEVLKTDDDAQVRRNATSALGHIGGERALEALLEILKTDDDTQMRMNATSALAHIGGERVVEAFLDALRTNSNNDVKVKVASELATFDSTKKNRINPDHFKSVVLTLRELLEKSGFDDLSTIRTNNNFGNYLYGYDVIWDALWKVCQKQSIV